MKDIRPLLDFLRANRAAALLAWASTFVASVAGVLLPLSIGSFTALVLGGGGGKDRLLGAMGIHLHHASAFFLFFFTLVAVQTLATYAAQYQGALLAERFASRLQRVLFARQLHGSVSTHALKPVGNYLLRYSGDLRGVRELLRKGALQASGDALFLLFALGAMLWLNVRFGSVVVGMFVFALMLAWLVTKPLNAIGQERRDLRARALAFVSARLHAFRTVKAFNRETPEIDAFERLAEKVDERTVRYERWNALLQALTPALFFVALGIILLLVQRDVSSGLPTSGPDVLGLVLLMLYMRSPLRRLLRVHAIWHSGTASLRKLTNIAERPVEVRTSTGLPNDFKGAVLLERVTFGYSVGQPVIKDLSAELPPNTISRMVGNGTSTVLALVQCMHRPWSGCIRYDGIDATDLTPFAIRKEIAMVSDELPLLGSTVLKAISYNTKEKNQERALTMLARLGIRWTDDPQQDLHRPLEEQATNLSRSERRMLQFARAFLTRKALLLLDEPFKDLGHGEVDTIVAYLNELRDKRTIILVSKDIPPALKVDRTIQLP